jgi:outer membrane protein TolC
MTGLVVGLMLLRGPTAAQDTLRLPALQAAAVEHDPRARQMALREAAGELRLANLATGWLPALTMTGSASHQSEVPAIPLKVPGATIPVPPKDRYEAAVSVEQALYDSGVLGRQREAERARLKSELAQVSATLYPLRAQVNEAFFQALSLQSALGETAALMADLEARLELVRAQAREGAALAGDTAAVRAELLRAGQSRSEAEAGRRAALGVLAELTGRPVAEAEVLAIPDFASEVAAIRQSGDDAVAAVHPQYAVFAAQRAALASESEVVEAEAGPRVAAFGEWAYGRPGLEQFTDRFHSYWMAGVRVHWQPWNWHTTARQREILEVQREVIDTEEAAFSAGLRRQVLDEEATIDRLTEALATDERIIELRGQVERQARAQLAERVITPAAYVSVRRDLQDARLARGRHRVELARAQASYLTTLGAAPR